MAYHHLQKNVSRQLLVLALAITLPSSFVARTNYSANLTKPVKEWFSNTESQSPALRANGKIAFTSNRDGNDEIYVMNNDGSNQSRLTNNARSDLNAAWSPEGNKIAFTSYRDGNAEIYVMNADGSNQINVTNSPATDRMPAWSPDGHRIAFTSNRNGYSEIHVMNADGTSQTRLVSGLDPSWSPDGSKIALVQRNGETSYSASEIHVVNRDGSSQVNLTNDQAFDDMPAWSPDGSRIVFGSSGTPWDYGSDIYVMNALGSNRTAYTNHGGSYDPAWSPDGSKIAYTAYAISGADIYVINADGSNQVRLTNNGRAQNREPDWQGLVTAASNPIDDATFFVRQHYADFLNREPDPGGWAYWTNEITNCGSNERCIHEQRIGVSGAFFVENEFQETGYVIYRIHRAAHGVTRIPCIDENGNPCGFHIQQNVVFSRFMTDRSRLVAGPGLPQSTLDFANDFVQRPEFLQTYPATMTAAEFVNTLFDKAELIGPENEARRQAAIQALMSGSRTRAQVLLDLIEITEFKTREYNFAFVLMQYFGYLRRDPELGGYNFWLDVLNNRVPGNYRSMICAFLTSAEYQHRFSSVITRTNADCGR
jgi:Tol biopolymer transport system component